MDLERDTVLRRRAVVNALSGSAQRMCAPFWWSIQAPDHKQARILHGGSICYIKTGVRELGITADHVYKQYLSDLTEFGAEYIECQFGGSTIDPQRHLVARSERMDLATFEIPEVFVTASVTQRKTQHGPAKWPPDRVRVGEIVLYGGYPAAVREERGSLAELPFEWMLGRLKEVTDHNIVFEPDFESAEWLGAQRNADPGGMSGGPVFRVAEGLIAHLELVGFIYEFPFGDAISARHADLIMPDGSIQDR